MDTLGYIGINMTDKQAIRELKANIKALQEQNQQLIDGIYATKTIRELVKVTEALSLALNEHLGFRYYSGGVKNFLNLIKYAEELTSKHQHILSDLLSKSEVKE